LFILGREPTGVGSVGRVSCDGAGDSLKILFYGNGIVPWINLGKCILTQPFPMRGKYLTPLPCLVCVFMIPKASPNNNNDKLTCSTKEYV
jgi:hypothetical protein